MHIIIYKHWPYFPWDPFSKNSKSDRLNQTAFYVVGNEITAIYYMLILYMNFNHMWVSIKILHYKKLVNYINNIYWLQLNQFEKLICLEFFVFSLIKYVVKNMCLVLNQWFFLYCIKLIYLFFFLFSFQLIFILNLILMMI